VWVTGVVAQRGGDVDRPRPTEHLDGQVAQGRHDVGGGAGADQGGVLSEGGVTDVAQRLDRPVAAQQVGQPGGAGLLEREAGDRVDGHSPKPPGAGVKVAGLADGLHHLRGARETEVADAHGIEGAQLDAPVAAIAGAVQFGHAVPGRSRCPKGRSSSR
jgi:hypothetical protein